MPPTVDVTGLSPDEVARVESLIASLRERRGQQTIAPPSAEAADRWRAAAEAVKGLADYDFGAWAEQRALDQQRAGDHLR